MTSRRQQMSLSSAIGGFAIGVLVTFFATVQVLEGSGSNGSGRAGLRTVGGANGGEALPAQPDVELGEGEELAFDETTGEWVVVDSSGEVIGSTGRDGSAGGVSASGGVIDGGGQGGVKGGGTGDLACAAGQNGGSTDTGVTATNIKFGATHVTGGIADAFLGEVDLGMEAVRNKVNRSGGVCGRLLDIVYKADDWDPVRGKAFIENLIDGEKVFALAVSPSSEGLNAASAANVFRSRGVPVVGADGLNSTQFEDPMIFPVAASTTTTINVMMKNALDRGAQNPAIVFGNTYKFGVEGAFAANAAYKKESGKDIPGYKNPLASGGGGCEGRFCGIKAGDSAYTGPVSTINNACKVAPACDFIILLLEPVTAQTWMGTSDAPKPTDSALKYGIGAPQPLFTHTFARDCEDRCRGMWMWTGYNPPISKYATSAAVAGYVKDLHQQKGSADQYNQFTMGGYVGMLALVAALKGVGPNLTRKALVDELNSMEPLETGLTAAAGLQWTPDKRYANHSAQAFEVLYQQGFKGWTLKTDPIRDIWLGQHAG